MPDETTDGSLRCNSSFSSCAQRVRVLNQGVVLANEPPGRPADWQYDVIHGCGRITLKNDIVAAGHSVDSDEAPRIAACGGHGTGHVTLVNGPVVFACEAPGRGNSTNDSNVLKANVSDGARRTD